MDAPKMFTTLIAAGIFTSGAAQSQSGPLVGPAGDRPSIGKPGGTPAAQPLTATELAKIKTVLAPYKPASLSIEDAKTIKRSLRDAGLRRSRELDAALASAGFSPEKLDALDPPPPRPAGEGMAPPLPLPLPLKK